MKYIMMGVHNNELFVINDMDAFTMLFCYSKRSRYNRLGSILPPESPGDAEISAYPPEIEDQGAADEDDL